MIVGQARTPPVDALDVEMVERKGLGHPDTICDALAEELSVALCRYYLEHFGQVLHHNVDKVLLWGGAARPRFGGGDVLAPIEIYLAGRAIHDAGGIRVPVADLAVDASRAWFRRHFRALDAERHVRIHPLVRPGSADLVALFLRPTPGEVPLANDTVIGVGFTPLSGLERAVMAAETRLNSPATKAACPAAGEDVKVLGVRRGGRIHLTVACALLAGHVASLRDYVERKETVRRIAVEAAQEASGMEVSADVNTADNPATGSIYLTVTGTSAESGDDGQAGRGNRANGLITPYRAMSLEATAGKNPVSHPGKLYQFAARAIAELLVTQIEEVLAAEVYLASRIGQPITDPEMADVKLQLREHRRPRSLAAQVEGIVRGELVRLQSRWRELIDQAARVP